VTLEVGRGTVFGLLGPNGAGKTTLVKILLGLVRKTGGRGEIFGRPIGAAPPRARVGFLPEAHRLPPYLTGWQVLRLFGQLCGRSGPWLDERIPHWLGQVGMTRDAHRKIREYSKGMQQRIGLAQALIHEPELVFLDEPTDGVDPVGRKKIRQVVQELKDKGTTIFINSHLLMEVELICDRVVIMDKGRIIKEGTTAELTALSGVVRFDLERYPSNLGELLAAHADGLIESPPKSPEGSRGSFELAIADDEIDRVIDALRAGGVGIRGITPGKTTLEDAFIGLIGEDRK
jgi:ABC-2 type transport system ATP-binding protein